MNIRMLLLFLVMALTLSCASAKPRGGASFPAGGNAVWEVDDDANVAYPRCPECGADADRKTSICSHCGARCSVVSKTIACPECDGSKHCTHCGSARSCVACNGTHVCAICDGTGKWHGEACPECEGAKACSECAKSHAGEKCGDCSGTEVCANCAGTGKITLR